MWHQRTRLPEALQLLYSKSNWRVRVFHHRGDDYGVFDLQVCLFELLEKRGCIERLAYRPAGQHHEHGQNLVPVLRHAVAHDPVGRELKARFQDLQFLLRRRQQRACKRAVAEHRTEGLHCDDLLAVREHDVRQLVQEHGLELPRRQQSNQGVGHDDRGGALSSAQSGSASDVAFAFGSSVVNSCACMTFFASGPKNPSSLCFALFSNLCGPGHCFSDTSLNLHAVVLDSVWQKFGGHARKDAAELCEQREALGDPQPLVLQKLAGL